MNQNSKEKITDLLEKHKLYLKETSNKDEIYKWEAIDHFQEYWDIDALDFSAMFLQSFKKIGNLLYQNSWGFIRKGIELFPEEVRQMFKVLYDEELLLEERFISFQKLAPVFATFFRNHFLISAPLINIDVNFCVG